MQIYTRTGDKGTTKIIGGSEISKASPRVEAYGTIDELNALIGFVYTMAADWPELQDELQTVQQYLYDCGNDLATPDALHPYRMNQEAVDWLESRVDEYSRLPAETESFILPGGTQLAAGLHMARTVTRRAERRMVAFMNEEESNSYALKFVNRLSDYFFAAARAANYRAGIEDVNYQHSGKVFHTGLSKDDFSHQAESD